MLHHTGTNFRTQANAVFLMGAFLIIRKNQSVQSVKELFGSQFLSSLQPFRDAGVGPDDFPRKAGDDDMDAIEGAARDIYM